MKKLLFSTAAMVCAYFSLSGLGDTYELRKDRHRPESLTTYSETFVSAGQPGSQFVETLAENNFDVVFNLAAPNHENMNAREQKIVTSAGLEYVEVVVSFSYPTQENVDEFLAYMKANPDKSVFVHCHMNYRASAFAFLHRVINLGESPKQAYSDMKRVWRPNLVWADLLNKSMRKNGIDYVVKGKRRK